MTTRANRERNGPSVTRLHRVLVVEDHAAFRRVVCELLQESAAVQIVGEAADGLDAVRKAEALQPDVVVLDVNLPTMSGLEVASHIRAVVPSAKVIFITVELSLEVMDEALRRGAHGYVYKPRAQRDLLSVLDAILGGAQFVSGGLERVVQGDSLASHRHDAVFCTDDSMCPVQPEWLATGQRPYRALLEVSFDDLLILKRVSARNGNALLVLSLSNLPLSLPKSRLIGLQNL